MVGKYVSNSRKSDIRTTLDFNQIENRVAVYKDAIIHLDKEIKMMDVLVDIIRK
jgi:hypothetical protein